MVLETLKIIELGLEYYALDRCPRKWERPNNNQCITYVCEPLRIVIKSINGTEKRTRTSTEFPPLAPEASVSTNSTTSAL